MFQISNQTGSVQSTSQKATKDEDGEMSGRSSNQMLYHQYSIGLSETSTTGNLVKGSLSMKVNKEIFQVC